MKLYKNNMGNKRGKCIHLIKKKHLNIFFLTSWIFIFCTNATKTVSVVAFLLLLVRVLLLNGVLGVCLQ